MNLAAFLLSITSTLTMRVLTSLGIGFVSYAALSTAVGGLITAVNSNYSLIDPVVLNLLNLAGFGTSLSITTAAITARVALLSIKKLQVLS